MFVALGAAAVRADDVAANSAPQSNVATVRQRLRQIELNVKLKQYEKVSEEFEDAKSNLILAQRLSSSETDKQAMAKLESRVRALDQVRMEISDEVLEIAGKLDEDTKVNALAASQTGK